MKKLFKSLMIGGCLLQMAGCAGSSEKVEYYPVVLDGETEWSFVDSKGKVVLSEEFSSKPSAVINGHFVAEEDGGYVVYKFDERHPHAVHGLEELKWATYYKDGLIGIVRPMERITFVDEYGEVELTLKPIGGREIVASGGQFSDGLLLVIDEDGNIGFVDQHGEAVVKPKYEYATEFSEGYAVVRKKGKSEKYSTYIIDKKGEEKVEIKKDLEPNGWMTFKGGIIPVVDNSGDEKRWGILDTKGEYNKLPSKVQHVTDYSSKVIVYVGKEGKYGVMTTKGEDMIRPKYDGIALIDNNKFIAHKGDKFMLIDGDGEKIESDVDKYENVYYLDNKGFGLLVEDDGLYQLADMSGKPINRTEFSHFSIGLTLCAYLESDYFDINAYVKSIAGLIDSDGIGKYRLGAAPSLYLSSPNSHIYISSFTGDEITESGYRYSFSAPTVYCTEIIAYSTWDPVNYIYDYSFNYDSKINAISVVAKTRAKVWNEAKPLLVSALADKGYKTSTDSDDSLTMTNGSKRINITSGYSGLTIRMSEE